MPNKLCIICGKGFYVKPSHLELGWGKYCSKICQFKGQKTGKTVSCGVCKKATYKNNKDMQKSKSGKYFCSKSCQTIWRNTKYSGKNHTNWSGGKSSYRYALLRSSRKRECEKCKTADQRILAVHHKDKNRDNNRLSNLIWLCHNCHYLVHHDKRESEGFVVVPVA